MPEVTQNLLVDYLTMSFKVSSEQSTCFFQWLVRFIHFPLDDAKQSRGFFRGYSTCFSYLGIRIYYAENLVGLDMSGKGCRMFEQLNPDLDWYEFLHFFDSGLTQPVKDSDGQCSITISRLDIAGDLLGSDRITVPFLQGYVRKDKFICKSTYHSCIDGNKEMAIYFGSPQSDRRLRIYDKAMEQGEDGQWVRFEFQLRNDNALSFYLNLSRTCGGNFTECYYGMLHDYLRFTTKPNTKDHTERLSVCTWWNKFLSGVRKIPQLYLPGLDYDIANISRNYRIQGASTVRALIEAAEGDISEIIDTAMNAKLNRRQQEALARLVAVRSADEIAAANSARILEMIGDG